MSAIIMSHVSLIDNRVPAGVSSWDMAEEIQHTIDVLADRVKAKEDEANKLKKLVNELCVEAGLAIRYQDVTATAGAIRTDQFYGVSLTAAIRSYLEIRKSAGLGAASVTDIYKAIKDGGYKFDTKNEENARIGVGNALRKTSSIFHRLPNGQYGLLSWYPAAKAAPSNGGTPKWAGNKKAKASGKKQTLALPAPAANAVTNDEVRDVILAQTGNFLGTDIEKILKEKYPSKTLSPTKVSTVLFRLKERGFLRVVVGRSGKTGATFAKA